MVFQNGVKSIQAAAYNGARMVVITKEIGIFFQFFLAFLECMNFTIFSDSPWIQLSFEADCKKKQVDQSEPVLIFHFFRIGNFLCTHDNI